MGPARSARSARPAPCAPLLSLLLFLLFPLCASAAWRISATSGATRTVTDGNWTLKLQTGASTGGCNVQFVSCESGGALDLSTIEADTGLTITETAMSAFRASTYPDLAAKLTSVSLPESLVYLRECAFAGCAALTTVVFPSDDAGFLLGHPTYPKQLFSQCTALTTGHPRGTPAVEGTMRLPATVTAVENYCFEGTIVRHFEGPSVVRVEQGAFKNAKSLETVRLSAAFTRLWSGSDGEGCFRGCTALVDFQPTVWTAVTELGTGIFRDSAVTNFFDLSPLSLTAIPARLFQEARACAGVSFPATVESVGAFACYQLAPGATIRFGAGVPTFAERALYPQSAAEGVRYKVFVDAAAHPEWTADDSFLKINASDREESDWPGPRALGFSSIGGGNKNWLVQWSAALRPSALAIE